MIHWGAAGRVRERGRRKSLELCDLGKQEASSQEMTWSPTGVSPREVSGGAGILGLGFGLET